MSRIYIQKNAFSNIKNIIINDTSKKYTVTLIKKYHRIHDILHSQRLFPIELENIITNYIDDIIDIKYHMLHAMSKKFIYLTFSIYQSINYVDYEFDFRVQLWRSSSACILDCFESDDIAHTTYDYDDDIINIDKIELFNTYLLHFNKKPLVLSNNVNRISIQCIYKQNIIACLFDNRLKICGIKIINHRKLQNVLVIINCIIKKLNSQSF